MIEELVRSGKARFEYRHFPLWADSMLPALAMECAADQSGNAFWRFHDEFMRSDSNTRGSRDAMIQFAREIGLEVNAFTTCLDERRHLERIEQSQGDAFRLGVGGTPTIHVDDEDAGQALSSITRLVEAAAE